MILDIRMDYHRVCNMVMLLPHSSVHLNRDKDRRSRHLQGSIRMARVHNRCYSVRGVENRICIDVRHNLFNRVYRTEGIIARIG